MVGTEKTFKPRKIHTNRSDVAFNIIVYAFSALLLLMILYPIYFIIVASFSDPAAVSTGKVWLAPVGFTLDGYSALLEHDQLWAGYRNTIVYTLLGTAFGLFVNIAAAYPLSRKDLVFRGPLMALFVIPMFFSGGLIPIFLTVKQFGLYNNFWVLIVPFAVSSYNVIVARTFFEGNIPSDMLDAAQIDGCGNLRFFFVIVLPLSKAIISVLALWIAVGHWNSYFNALIYLRDDSLMPLQIILRNILITNQMQSSMGTGEHVQIAMRKASLMRYSSIIVSTVPIMCFYPFVQKHFNQGVMVGAVKG